MNGDFADVSARLPSKKLIEKFTAKFLEDISYETLCKAMKDGSRKEAFRAAHTLKGVCANMGFSRLLSSSARLTELLRPEQSVIPEEAYELLETVSGDYRMTTDAIRRFLEG